VVTSACLNRTRHQNEQSRLIGVGWGLGSDRECAGSEVVDYWRDDKGETSVSAIARLTIRVNSRHNATLHETQN